MRLLADGVLIGMIAFWLYTFSSMIADMRHASRRGTECQRCRRCCGGRHPCPHVELP